MRRLATALVIAGAVWVTPARADAPMPETRLSCRREAAPGRVLCELEVELGRGRLVWADALVTRAPDFAHPLRARVGPQNAAAASERRMRIPIALAATASGRGELEVRARAVVCAPGESGSDACWPFSRTLSTIVEVGVVEQR